MRGRLAFGDVRSLSQFIMAQALVKSGGEFVIDHALSS
jgi:hypothetical protein